MCCEENPPFDYWRFSSRESNQDGITEGKKFDKNRLSKVYNWKKLLSWQICYMLRLLPSIFCLFVTTAPSTTSFFIGLFSDYTKRSIGKTFPASAENNITLWTFLHFSLASFLASKIKVICHLSLHFSFFCSCYILRIVIVTHQASSRS